MTEFSEENLAFWMACEKYKTLSGKRRRTSKAKKIYSHYVDTHSPKMVSLTSSNFGILRKLRTDKHVLSL